MTTKLTLLLSALLIAAALGVGMALSSRLPERVPAHWDAQGQVNGYASRSFAIFFTPVLTIGLTLLLTFLPYLDPLKANIDLFRKQYNIFILVMVGFMTYLHFWTLAAGLGAPVNMTLVLVPAFAALDFFLGFLLGKARRNWFIGIRTPWTLSSDRVWIKTHRLGAQLFALAGVLTLLGVLFPSQAFFFMILPLLLVALVTVVYSYFAYRQEGNR